MRIATCAAIASLTLLGTVVAAQSVTYDYDRTVDFSRFRTYTWVRGTDLSDELNHRRVTNAIDAQLAAKGLVKVEGGGSADLLVAYHADFDREVQINASATGWGPYRLGGGTGTARASEVVVGNIALEMTDARTDSIVWRGTASRDVDAKANPEKREKSINKAAEKLLKHYPPKR